jgi:hypothetical protein
MLLGKLLKFPNENFGVIFPDFGLFEMSAFIHRPVKDPDLHKKRSMPIGASIFLQINISRSSHELAPIFR